MWCIGGVANWNISQNGNWHVPFVGNSHVCFNSKHILTNCVFLTIFPTIVDLFELSFSFSHTFLVFSAIEVLLYWIFRYSDKDFFCIFAGTFWDFFLAVCPVKWDLTYHRLAAPETQYDKLNIYKCTLQLQLTIMSDELWIISFWKPLSRCPDSMKQKQCRGPSFWNTPFYTF